MKNKEKLKAIYQILLDSPELNMSNYIDDEEVFQLNNAVNEAYSLLEDLLKEEGCL